jgi:hypothetical protein
MDTSPRAIPWFGSHDACRSATKEAMQAVTQLPESKPRAIGAGGRAGAN